MYRSVLPSTAPSGVACLSCKHKRGLRTPFKNQKFADHERGRISCESASSSSDQWHDAEEEVRTSLVPDKLPVAGVDTDWREFRARLVASSSGVEPSTSRQAGVWAHSVPTPEKGCLLLAHPLMFDKTQTYFRQSVIFLFEHGPTGSAGLILNKATEYAIGSLAGAEQLCPEFADNILYLGGDVGKETVHLLHSFPDVEGSIEVVNGVFMGGFEAAKVSVSEGRIHPQQFRWFTRYAGWAPGQLEREVEAGVWFTAAAGKGIVLPDMCLSGRSMWHNVLELMGGEFMELSMEVKGAYRPDMMGHHGTAGADTPKDSSTSSNDKAEK